VKWGRLRTGERLHAIVDDKPLCGCPGEVIELAADEPHHTRLQETFPECGNCEKEWRRRGRENKPKTPPVGESSNDVPPPQQGEVGMSRKTRNRAGKVKCDRCKGSCNVRVACPDLSCKTGLCPTCLPIHYHEAHDARPHPDGTSASCVFPCGS
jgi:hypothetical protein